jgi:antitoxin ParD1/3/4
MDISLPESLKSWVEEQAASAGYASPAEYVQQLLHKEQQEQKRKLRQEVEQKLVDALDSGDPVEVTPEFWQARHEELRRRLTRQGKAEGQ